MLVAMRNRLTKKNLLDKRLSLSPEGYAALVAAMPHRLIAYSDVLGRCIHR
jgi:hypothetical protein